MRSCYQLLGCLLFAGCSLDASPATPKANAASKDTSWQPAAAQSTRVDAERDAGIDAATDMTTGKSVGVAPRDAGHDTAAAVSDSGARPSTIDAAMQAPKPDAAIAPPPMDASTSAPDMPATPARDAAMPMRVDASAPSRPDASPSSMGGASSPAPACKPGVYAGTFTGSLQAVGVPVSTITGAINANLTEDPFGAPYLNVRDLRIVGADESGNTMTVTVSGDINCVTNLFENGLLQDGVYYMVSSRTELPFAGVAQGAYMMNPYALNGTWTVEAQGTSSLLGGNGEFKLVLNP